MSTIKELARQSERCCILPREFMVCYIASAYWQHDVRRLILANEEKMFSGRAAIVTGATRGIGRAIALELARRGTDVAFNYAKSAEAADTLKADIEALGVRSLAMQCDVANTDAAAEMVKQTKDVLGRIDFLVT